MRHHLSKCNGISNQNYYCAPAMSRKFCGKQDRLQDAYFVMGKQTIYKC